MAHLRHFLIRNKRKKFGLIFTAIVCYGLRAAETSLLSVPRPNMQDDTSHVAEMDQKETHVEKAKFMKSIPFPFELVHDTWENGPVDENLIRADVEVSHSGSEEVKRKMIYTRNPLPYLLRKTIVREDEFVFQEEQHIDMRKKYSKLWSINRSYQDAVQAHRTFALREDPHRKGFTIMEQTLSVSISNSLGGATIARQLEKIARSTFMSGCDKAIADLEKTLAKLSDLQLRKSDGAHTQEESEQMQGELAPGRLSVRKLAETVVSRGLILAGAALRVWAHIKAPHHTCPRQLEPASCHLPPKEAHVAEGKGSGLAAPRLQEAPTFKAEERAGLRNPLKRMMSVAAAAFVSV